MTCSTDVVQAYHLGASLQHGCRLSLAHLRSVCDTGLRCLREFANTHTFGSAAANRSPCHNELLRTFMLPEHVCQWSLPRSQRFQLEPAGGPSCWKRSEFGFAHTISVEFDFRRFASVRLTAFGHQSTHSNIIMPACCHISRTLWRDDLAASVGVDHT